jgi:hypothetical protein
MKQSSLKSAFVKIVSPNAGDSSAVPVPTPTPLKDEPIELSPLIEDLLEQLSAFDQDALEPSENGAGRPTRMNSKTVRTIMEAIVIGATYKDACESVGIWHNTLLTWAKKGETEPESKYGVFNEVLNATNGLCAVRYTKILHTAANKDDAKYALEWLKRRKRNDWGDNTDLTTNNEKVEFIVTYVNGVVAPMEPS